MKSLNANPAPSHCLHGSAAFVLVLCGLILASGCQKSDSGTHPSSVVVSASAAKSDPVKTAEVDTDVPQSTDAILKAMVAAYQTAQNYSDKGTVSIRGTKAGKPMDDQPVDYTMAFERPNKLRLAVFRGAVISDGNQWHAFVQQIPGQIVERKAPARITPAEIFSDAMLMDAITQGPTMGVSWLPVQALLLLADDPLKTLLYGAQKTESLTPTPLNGISYSAVGFQEQWVEFHQFQMFFHHVRRSSGVNHGADTSPRTRKSLRALWVESFIGNLSCEADIRDSEQIT